MQMVVIQKTGMKEENLQLNGSRMIEKNMKEQHTMKIEKEEAQTVDVQIQEEIDLETVKDLEEKLR
ncbi:Uncharacterised protein [Clostridioides difficile]|nr:Uncharacterised protein [Clostridioides difficile]VHS03580.1 Uncharacterised protein [Clostridioides difficile]